MPIELGDSWFSAKDILVSRLITPTPCPQPKAGGWASPAIGKPTAPLCVGVGGLKSINGVKHLLDNRLETVLYLFKLIIRLSLKRQTVLG